MATERFDAFDGSGWVKDDVTRTYRAWDRNGTTIMTRPYNATEAAEAIKRLAESAKEQARNTLRANVESELSVLTKNADDIEAALADPTFDQNAVARLRDLAVITARGLRDLVSLARIVLDAVDEID